MNCDEILSYINEYPQSYKFINIKDKIVLDIGGDVGTSAFYFLALGAKKVIVYSLQQQKVFDSRIEWHNEWNGLYIPADVLKIDCEGCECSLTKETIEKYNEWYIAIHIWSDCFENMKKYIETKGILTFITPDKKELMYTKFKN